MKQTNGALTLLLKAYRSVFKAAYIKGLASAVVLTAGLSTGVANAAYDPNVDYNYYLLTTGALSSSPTAQNGNWSGYTTGQLVAPVDIAGEVGENSANSGNLTLGTGQTAIGTSGNAAGGVVVSTSNIGSLSANGNHLNLTQGAEIGKSAYGAYVNATVGGDVFANSNEVNITGSVTIGNNSPTNSDGIFGVRIKTADGNARAENNKVNITSTNNLFYFTDKDGNGIVGALAEGTDSVVVTENSVKITENSTTQRLNLNNVDTIRGGFALNQENSVDDNASILTAQNNGVDLTRVQFGVENSGAYIMGGVAQNDSGGAGTYSALNNTVKLTDSKVTYSGNNGSNGDLQIIGNFAWAHNSSSTPANQDVIANGDGTNTTLEITDSEISMLNSAETGSSVDSAIMGAYADTVSGDATANQNIVKISNTQITNANAYGAVAVGSGDSAQVVSSKNQISIDAGSVNFDKTTASSLGLTNNGIMGTRAEVKFTNAENTSLTANENTVSITYNTPATGTPKINVDADIYGASAITSNSGSTVTVNSNSVNVGSNVVVDGDIYGANATHNAKMAENSVVFDGELTGHDIIGAAAGADGRAAPTEISKVNTILSNNTVTIGENAVLKDVSIYAAKATSNDYIIHEGNTTTINGIYAVTDAAGSETLAQDNLQVNGSATIYNKGILTIAGFEKTAGSEYYTGTGTIADGAKVINANKINIYNSLNVEGDDTLVASSTGAQLVIDGNKDNASNSIPNYTNPLTEGATLKISEAGLKNYLTATDKTTATNLPASLGSYHDDEGAVQVTSGGAIDFKDSVTLSNFDFDDAASTAGKIQVDTGTISAVAGSENGSIFRADTVNIEHTLAKDKAFVDSLTTTPKQPYTSINASGIVVEADTLNLGTSSLAGEDTAKINFGYALVTNSVNFENGAVSTSAATLDDYAGFRLTSEIVLDAKQEVKDLATSKGPHFHALEGSLNGDFRLGTTPTGTTPADSGEINVINGIWTANGTVTLASGGSIKVGAGLDTDTHFNANPFVTDAILTLNNALDVDLSQAGTAGSITVSGDAASGRYDLEDYGTKSAHDNGDKLALLDLRAGINLVGDKSNYDQLKGTASISASNGGVIVVDGANLSEVLAESGREYDVNSAGSLTTIKNNGVLFNISSQAQLVADGDVSADFADFGGGSTQVSTGINLNSGYFVADSLTLTADNTQTTHQDDSAYIGSTGNTINFGNGTVEVNDLTISDNTQTNKTAGSANANYPYASSVTLASGTVEIANSLTVSNPTLYLGVAGGTTATLTFFTDSISDSGALTVENINVRNGSVNFHNGNWDAHGTTFTLGATGALNVGGSHDRNDINGLDPVATVTANRIVADDAAATINVKGDGNLTVNTVDFSKLDANSVTVDGHLTINGDASYTVSGSTEPTRNGVLFGTDGSIVVNNNGHLTFGADATAGAIIANGNYSGDTVTLVDGFTQIQNNGGEVELGLSDGTMFSADAILDLKNKLFTAGSLNGGVLQNGGVINIGDAGFQGIELTDDGDGTYTVTWDKMKSWSDIETNSDVTNSRLTKTNVTEIKVSDQVRGHYGALRMDSAAASNAQVDLYGHTSLRYAEGNNGFFISNADGSAALGAKIGAGKSLTLIDGGKIGAITLDDKDGSNGDTELTVQGSGETTIASIKGDATQGDSSVYINGVTNVTSDITDVDYVEVTSSLTANKIDVADLSAVNGSVVADSVTVEEGSAFAGTITAKNFTYEGEGFANDHDNNLEMFNGGKLAVSDTLKVADPNGNIFVGMDLTEEDLANLALEGYTNVTGTGYLEVNTLDLNGGTLYVDPAYGEATSLAAIKTFKEDKAFTVANNVGNAHGNIFVGKNAALGIGTDLAGLQDAIASYQENGSLSADKYGSILYLNGQVKLASNTLVALDSDIDVNTDSQFRQVREYTENGSTLLADMGLGDKTAMIMSTNAFADKDGNKTGTAVTFDKDKAVINNEGSVIILQGSFATGDKLNFFNDKGNDGIKLVGENLEFFSENGFLKGVIEVGENVGLGETLEVDRPQAYNIMHEASDPVVETLIAYGNRNAVVAPAPEAPEEEQQPQQPVQPSDPNADSTDGTTTTQPGNSIASTESTLATPTTGTSSSGSNTTSGGSTADNTQTASAATYSSDFLDAVITTSHGAPAENAARLAVYGGAVQAAMAAGQTSYEAIATRMGMGNPSSVLTYADNADGAGIWLAPVYKNHDSDGFDAEGLDYGVDMDLYGVALGVDYTFAQNFRAGVMFNVGSGDADGQGAGSAVSNDFDYWGVSAFGGYTYENFAITADIGYSVVDNDLDAGSGLEDFGTLTASTDTTSLTLGVNAQYKFEFDALDVTPHVGARFTRIDMDDYSIDSAQGKVAEFNADSMNIFSIPVGVSFSKDIQAGSWSVMPALDLVVTANTGDDEFDGDVDWTDTPLSTATSTEVLDSFTYGANLGISAKTGAFSLGIGVNYVGSSNADELGVQANARFTF